MELKIIGHTWALPPFVKFRKRRITDMIVLHCAATPEGKDYMIEDIDRWHRERSFDCVGYHYVIYRDGSIHQGRPEDSIGAHASGYNSRSIGICYIGGIDALGVAKDTRTKEQKESMMKLVKMLMMKYHLNFDSVRCHNQLAAKACPSFKIDVFKREFLKNK